MKIEIVLIAAGLALTGALIAWEPQPPAAQDAQDAQASRPQDVARGEELISIRPYVKGSFAAPSAGESAAPQEKKPPGPKLSSDGTLLLTFEDLACFTYEHPDPRAIKEGQERPKQIPDDILALKGKTVIAEGHMVPISVKKGKVTAFVLSRYLEGCCFGQPAMMNEWIDVEMTTAEGAEYYPYGTILCTGVLDVGEQLDEYGYVRSIYRMKCSKVEEAQK